MIPTMEAGKSPEDFQQPGQGRGNQGRDDVNDEGDREQVRREGAVELPRLAEYARKGIHSEIVRVPASPRR